jgi:SAM-dependent methyltransferase
MTSPAPGRGEAETFFRESDYWRAWSTVPDATADVAYALRALRPAHRSVLDVPCGRGRLLKAIAGHRPDLRIVGVDVNRDMVRQAQESVPCAVSLVGSVYELPFDDRAFDLVACHQSFMHFEQPAVAIRELTRVARHDVYFSVTTRRQLNTLLRRLGLLGVSDVPHWTYNAEDLQALLTGHEFVWTVTGAFLLGSKALRLSHARYSRLHHVVGRRVPQWLLRRFGQTLFVYGHRRGVEAS